MKRPDIVRLAREHLRAYRRAEATWRNSINLGGRTIQCKRGCSHCCYQLPLGNLVTGVLIAEHLRWEPELLDKVIKQGHRQMLCMMEFDQDEQGVGAASEHWFQKVHEPCALLREDGDCEIYELRPACCSSYFVVSDPGLCARATATTMVGSPDNAPVLAIQAMADGDFLAEVFNDERWKGGVLVAPIGVMVSAGMKLLDDPSSFLDMINDAIPFEGVQGF